jgi:hypothetical protein
MKAAGPSGLHAAWTSWAPDTGAGTVHAASSPTAGSSILDVGDSGLDPGLAYADGGSHHGNPGTPPDGQSERPSPMAWPTRLAQAPAPTKANRARHREPGQTVSGGCADEGGAVNR